MPVSKTTSTKIVAKCGNPRCNCPIIEWEEEAVAEKPENLPERVWKMIRFNNFVGQGEVFFTKACLLDWLRDYVPLKSPQEQEREKAEREKKVIQFPETKVVPEPQVPIEGLTDVYETKLDEEMPSVGFENIPGD